MGARIQVVVLFALYFGFILTGILVEVPLVRLVEQAICNQHFRRATPSPPDHIDESDCKVPEVQDALANIIGWKLSFDAVPGTFDVVFPVHATWLSSLFMLVGGGRQVYFAMVLTLVSDKAEHRNRTRLLYIFSAGAHTCSLVAPPAATGLMSLGTMIPFWFTFGLLGLVLICSFIIGEMDSNATNNADDESAQHPANSPIGRTGGINHEATDLEETPFIAPAGAEIPEVQTTIANLRDMFHIPGVRFVLVAFFVKRIAFMSEQFMFQHASEKFGFPLRETAILRFAVGSGAVFATTVIGPSLSAQLLKCNVSPQKIDINTVRAALLLLGTAFTGAWQASSMAALIVAMGFAGMGEMLEPSLQGFATLITDSTHNALLFTSVATCDSLANLIGGPLDSYLMALGRRPGHQATGYMFLGSSVMFYGLFLWACSLPLMVPSVDRGR